MHANHGQQGTMYVITLNPAALAALMDRLDGAHHARIAIEVAPDAPPVSEFSPDLFLGDLKVSPNDGMWSPAIGTVGVREASMYDVASA